MEQVSIQERTKLFATRIIKAYSEINNKYHFNDAPAILSKQFLRSGTSIGAMCREAKSAQSTKDFVHKYEIALKEARETEYWFEILAETDEKLARKFVKLQEEIDIIIKILVSSINTSKRNS